MPSQLILDVSSLDLSAVHTDAEGVGKVIPQAGHMRQLGHVIWVDQAMSLAVGVKYVKPDEFWVPGHIPGRPILPGVLMIEAGAQLASFLFATKMSSTRFLGFIRCDDTTFRGQVVPGDVLYLMVREELCQPRRMVSLCQGVLNGKLVFESRVTGMVI